MIELHELQIAAEWTKKCCMGGFVWIQDSGLFQIKDDLWETDEDDFDSYRERAKRAGIL